MKNQPTAKGEKHVLDNQNLPTPFIDHARVSIRKDGLCFVQLSTDLPTHIHEQIRMFTTVETLLRIGTIMQEAANGVLQIKENKEPEDA